MLLYFADGTPLLPIACNFSVVGYIAGLVGYWDRWLLAGIPFWYLTKPPRPTQPSHPTWAGKMATGYGHSYREETASSGRPRDQYSWHTDMGNQSISQSKHICIAPRVANESGRVTKPKINVYVCNMQRQTVRFLSNAWKYWVVLQIYSYMSVSSKQKER